jgi:hypothetical protein
MEINIPMAMFLPTTISSVAEGKGTLAKHFGIGSNYALFQRSSGND